MLCWSSSPSSHGLLLPLKHPSAGLEKGLSLLIGEWGVISDSLGEVGRVPSALSHSWRHGHNQEERKGSAQFTELTPPFTWGLFHLGLSRGMGQAGHHPGVAR